MKFIFSIFLLIFLFFSNVYALDIYSFLTKNCKLTSGLIINVDSSNITVLKLDGKSIFIKKDEIEYIFIFNTFDNPFKQIYMKKELTSFLKKIYIDGSSKKSIIAWPVKFIENLVVFYDIKGKSHIFELTSLSRLRPYNNNNNKSDNHVNTLNLKYQPLFFNLSNISTKCKLINKQIKSNGIIPTRILSDKIRISEFISSFEEGFERVNSFQERTYLYAKPFLFEKESKLGLVSFQNYLKPKSFLLPFYFQWSSGKEYRFQTYNVVGGSFAPWLPSAEIENIIRSELKSHIFHGTFVGNILALPAGQSYLAGIFHNNSYSQEDEDQGKKIIYTYTSLNYMALMGLDWGPYSFSFGNYYPIFGIQVNEISREILASELSPIFRFRYIKPKYEFYFLYSLTNISAPDGVSDDQIRKYQNESIEDIIKSFNFDSNFYRIGFKYQFNPQIIFGADYIHLIGNYKEKLFTEEINKISFTHNVLSLNIRHDFGKYITLKAYLNMYQVNRDVNFTNLSDNENNQKNVFGGVFEFIF